MVRDAISSVFDTAGNLAVEIIIADNGSTDGSLDAIRKQFGNRITIVEMGKNAGFAAANNAGAKIANGEYLLFLNPDTIVLNGALQAMVEYMDAHAEIGACGGNLYSRTMQPQFSYWTLFPGVKMEWHGLWSDYFLRQRHHGSHEHNYTQQPKSVAYCMGADLMVRKSVWEQVGGMDEAFFLFYEETELCYRIHRAGYGIVNIPQAKIIHLEGQTIDKLSIRRQQMMRSRTIYLCKCCSPAERWMANLLLRLSCRLRVGWFALRGNKEKVKYWNDTYHWHISA